MTFEISSLGPVAGAITNKRPKQERPICFPFEEDCPIGKGLGKQIPSILGHISHS